ncbi:hypothetical protein HanRHA438_Chr11g0505501 [Helianthus annuus]|uniref:Uncharacterized protein n=1 Tax=Helianthus annuus TaxID=4232 RepID=A0A251U3Z4_HELAN|nr:hypothetical protein HanXRQr2_Chr11g0492871 [Helianthus annuus]KAJ0870877.1 hypothetical protein HanRHA438_Chr11g0505501 [Helianthus annuus]KAJ0875327.1 hypothetical protein HanPSC8_Chr11g0474931 [Helianthus annuus]
MLGQIMATWPFSLFFFYGDNNNNTTTHLTRPLFDHKFYNTYFDNFTADHLLQRVQPKIIRIHEYYNQKLGENGSRNLGLTRDTRKCIIFSRKTKNIEIVLPTDFDVGYYLIMRFYDMV